MALTVWSLLAVAVLLQLLTAWFHTITYEAYEVNMTASLWAYITGAAASLAMGAASCVLIAAGVGLLGPWHVIDAGVSMIGVAANLLAFGINRWAGRAAVRRYRHRRADIYAGT